MTDKKSSTPETPSNTDASSPAPTKTKASSKVSSQKPSKKASESVKPASQLKVASSSLPIVAILLALLAVGGSAGLFYWQNQQHTLLKNQLLTQSSAKNSETLVQVQDLLKAQQQNFNSQLDKNAATVLRATEKERLALKEQVDRLSQNQPSDWLLHEAEYLIRIAARTIWLEKDTKAAINLLQDANNRIQELNDPHYLPLRQIIHDDIEALKLLPPLATQETVLTLISLQKHVKDLPLSMVKVPEQTEEISTFELSEDANDWKANLANTWNKFLKDFITINRRKGNVEPLLSPEYQQNLRENLSLKLQLAQWATVEENADVYLAALNDIDMWMKEYFSPDAPQNILFIKEITTLRDALITYQYPSSLDALQAIRDLLKTKNIHLNTPKKTDNKHIIDLTPYNEKPTVSETNPVEGA